MILKYFLNPDSMDCWNIRGGHDYVLTAFINAINNHPDYGYEAKWLDKGMKINKIGINMNSYFKCLYFNAKTKIKRISFNKKIMHLECELF